MTATALKIGSFFRPSTQISLNLLQQFSSISVVSLYGGSMVSQSISHYRIIRKLGQGGMGEVFLAEDTTLERKVAIKLLPARSIESAGAKRRLIREAKAAATLDHPNICAIY